MEYLEHVSPTLALVAVVLLLAASLIVIVNIVGRWTRRHGEVLRIIALKLDNLHHEKREQYKRSLQHRPGDTARPPPLSEAPTMEITEEMLLKLTRDMSDTKATRKLKDGKDGDDG